MVQVSRNTPTVRTQPVQQTQETQQAQTTQPTPKTQQTTSDVYEGTTSKSVNKPQETPNELPTIMSKEEFLTELANRRMSAAAKIPGVNVAAADLNNDGVIAGKDEWSAAFHQVDRVDKNGDAGSINPSLKPVNDALTALRSAPEATTAGRSVYSKAEMNMMSYALEGGDPNIGGAKPYEGPKKDYLGRSISSRAVELDLNAGPTKSVTVVYDPANGRFFKKLDGKAPVPLTADESKALTNNLKDHHPNQVTENNDFYKRLFIGAFPKEVNKIDFESPT